MQVVGSTLSAILFAARFAVVRSLAIAPQEVIDREPILIDEPFDALARGARLRTRICHRTTETHVVPNEFLPRRIGERFFHICLLDLEVAVDVSTIVGFAAFRHLLMLPCCWSAPGALRRQAIPSGQGLCARKRRARYVGRGALTALALDDQYQIAPPFPEILGLADPQSVVHSVDATVATDAVGETQVLRGQYSEVPVS